MMVDLVAINDCAKGMLREEKCEKERVKDRTLVDTKGYSNIGREGRLKHHLLVSVSEVYVVRNP